MAGSVFCCLPDDDRETLVVISRWMPNMSAEESAPCCWTLVRPPPVGPAAVVAGPSFRCSPKIGPPEIATRKQASSKYPAVVSPLPKVSTMRYSGCRWHVQSVASRFQGAGKYPGNRAAPLVDDIPVYRRPDILRVRSFEPN